MKIGLQGISYTKVKLSPTYMTIVQAKRQATVSFYLNIQKRKGELFYLYARIIYMRRKAEFSLGVLISLDEWDLGKGQLINKKKNMNTHKQMNKFESEIFAILEDRIARNLPVSTEIIKRIKNGDMALDSPEGAIYMLIPFIESQIIIMEKNKSEYTEQTVGHYRTLKGHIQVMLSMKGLIDVPIHTVNTAFVQEMDEHLLTWINPKLGRAMNRNTANKNHSKFKAILSIAMRKN